MKHKKVFHFGLWNKISMAWIRMIKDVRTNNLRTLKDILIVNFNDMWWFKHVFS